METVSCNLCHRSDAPTLYHLSDWLLNRPAVNTTLVTCPGCGLVYQNPRPTIEEMQAHYPLEYESYSTQAVAPKLPWLLKKAYTHGLKKRARAVLRFKQQGRLLDVGCAAGIFLSAFQKFFAETNAWSLHGVELNLKVAEIARQRGLDVFAGTLEQAAFPDSSFDVITLWDVLEHLHDPAASLGEIRRILKPDGLLVLRVPNLDSWDATLFGPYWAGLDTPRHLYAFSPQTLNKLLSQHDFVVRRMDCDVGSYPTFVLSVRFWLTAHNVPVNLRDALVKLLNHPALRILSAPFFWGYSLGLRGPVMTVAATPSNIDTFQRSERLANLPEMETSS